MKAYRNFKNLLNRLFFSTSEKNSDLYNSLEDLPIFNWWKISNGEYKYLSKENKPLELTEEVSEMIGKLQQDFFDRYGVSDDFEDYFETQKELLELQVDLAITGDRFLNTKINLIKQKLQAKQNYKRKGEEYELKAYLDKYLGMQINTKTTSVVEYYGYLELMKKDNRNGKN